MLDLKSFLAVIFVFVSATKCNVTLKNHISLKDGVYDLFWGYDSKEITFEVQVKTKGYVGLGFSPNGGMANSDIVIAWVKDGKTFLKDRFATSKSLPMVDPSQDVTLISGSENATHTIIRFSRKLNTCDKEHDRQITSGTTRLIWAYHASDPADENTISYHTSSQRGSESIQLIAPEGASEQPRDLPNDVITMEFSNSNVSIPTTRTTYWCKGFHLPKRDKQHYMIKYEQVVQPGHETLVHHIIINACYHPVNKSLDLKESICRTKNMPPEFLRCDSPIVAWAIGGGAFAFPDHVGYPMLFDKDPDFFMMETHYDNPDQRSDFVDSSGVRIYLTPTPRKYDAAVLTTGNGVSALHLVPPHYSDLQTWGQCAKECLSEAMVNQSSGINVFATLLHTHLLGRRIYARHFRNGIEQPWISADDSYDFNFQEIRMIKEITVKPGDDIVADCHYNSVDKTNVTFGGEGTDSEMCLAFLFYYPKIDLTQCVTYLRPNNIGTVVPYQTGNTTEAFWKNFISGVNTFNWADEKNRAAFQNLEKTANRTAYCAFGKKTYPISNKQVSHVVVTRDYVPPDTCTVVTPTRGDPSTGERVFSNIVLLVVAVSCIPLLTEVL